MKIELPSGKIKVVLKSMSRKAYRELSDMRAETMRLAQLVEDGDSEAEQSLINLNGREKRESLTLALYPEIKNPDEMDNRDLAYLMTATEEYTIGKPEAAIKNLLASGEQETTRTA